MTCASPDLLAFPNRNQSPDLQSKISGRKGRKAEAVTGTDIEDEPEPRRPTRPTATRLNLRRFGGGRRPDREAFHLSTVFRSLLWSYSYGTKGRARDPYNRVPPIYA